MGEIKNRNGIVMYSATETQRAQGAMLARSFLRVPGNRSAEFTANVAA
jgi:hypothetical protein